MAAASPSTAFNSSMHSFTIIRFAQTETHMSFAHETEIVFLLDQFKVFVAYLFDVISADNHCVILGYPGNHFILLSLVLYDSNLLSIFVTKLLSKKRVAGCDYDGLPIDFWKDAGNSLPNCHHCRVAYLGVPFLFYFSFLAD
jgi:hypothetical protein